MSPKRIIFFLTVSGLLTALSGCVTAPPKIPTLQLGEAMSEGNAVLVQKLLAEGVEPGAGSGRYIIPFQTTAYNGHEDISRLVLKKCTEIYVRGSNCSNALEGAVILGDSEALNVLLDKGADPNDSGYAAEYKSQGNTPLAWSASTGHLECAKILFKRGADIDLAIQELETRIAYLSAMGGMTAPEVISKAQAGLKLLERLRPAQTAPAVTAGGISSEDLAKVYQAAAAGAAAQAASKSAAPALSSDVDRPTFKLPQRTDDFAVVVGIEKYSEVPPAQFADRDAKAMRDSLVAMGYPERNIVLLQGERATKTGLIKNLETWLPRNVNGKSTVFFYYSGHGAPDPKTGQAYLVPFDGDPQYLEDTGYPMKRLYEKLGALKVKQVIVAMDSCFSGAGGRSVLAKGTRPLVGKIDLGQAGGRNIISLTASASDQISGTIEEQGHGAFTYYLLRGINGAARDDKGAVTVKSLYDYLLPNVQDSARRGNRDQTPQLQDANSSSASLRLR